MEINHVGRRDLHFSYKEWLKQLLYLFHLSSSSFFLIGDCKTGISVEGLVSLISTVEVSETLLSSVTWESFEIELKGELEGNRMVYLQYHHLFLK